MYKKIFITFLCVILIVLFVNYFYLFKNNNSIIEGATSKAGPDPEELKHYNNEFKNLLKRSKDTLKFYENWNTEMEGFEDSYNNLRHRYDNMNKENMKKSNKAKKKAEDGKKSIEDATGN